MIFSKDGIFLSPWPCLLVCGSLSLFGPSFQDRQHLCASVCGPPLLNEFHSMGTKVSWGEPGRKAITPGPKSAPPPIVAGPPCCQSEQKVDHHKILITAEKQKPWDLKVSLERVESIINMPKGTRQLKHRSKHTERWPRQRLLQ